MSIRLYLRSLTIACLLMLPVAALAQLRSPTYGWNLGNTFEAPDGVGTWAPAPTQALINAVANAGFNTVRIPCAWNSNANQSTNQINATYMTQVKQTVDWCFARNLTVIINCHWDGGWLDGSLENGYNATVNTKMNSFWTQIANTFRDYDSRLLFAGANEPPVDTASEMSTLLSYYQTFVTAVRNTGGSNTSRWLVLSGPYTNLELTDQLMNTMPNDPTAGRLAVEVHYYPYQYCLMTADADWGKMFYFWGQGYHHPTRTDRNSSWGEEDYADSQFQLMYNKFVSRGIPVVLGEFAAVRRTGYSDLTGSDLNLHLAGRTYFYKVVVDKANALGIRPIYWDEGWLGSNGSAVFDRSNGAVTDADSVRALTGGAALPPPASSAPSAPSSLSATVASSSQINLTWTDNASNESGFQLQRATNSGFSSGLTTTTLGSNATSSQATGLSASTTYYFRVRATNSAGSSAYSNTANATTQASGGGGGIIANGTYRIVARHSGRALDVASSATADGSNVHQWTYGGGNNQRWTITHLGNNQYSIVGVQSGKALDVSGWGTSNGSNVHIWTYGGGANQKWTVTATSGGYYRLTPTHATNMSLDVNGVSSADGANVQIWTYGGGNNQQWGFQAP